MQYQNNLLNSISQCKTPLNTLFFSEFNIERIQKGIQNYVKNKTSRTIDRQNKRDIITIMRSVFINNSINPYGNACNQVDILNKRVIETAGQQVLSGLSQYLAYVKDIGTTPVPLDLPRNVSTYGDNTNINIRIGM